MRSRSTALVLSEVCALDPFGVSEANPNLGALINENISSLTRGSVVEEIRASRKAFAAIAASVEAGPPARGSFEYRMLKQGLIVTQVSRFDSSMTVVPYLYHAVASRNPLIEISGADTELFKRYQQEVETVWRLAESGPS